MKAQFGNRQLFPKLKPFAYCNHAAISPPSQPVEQAVASAVQHYAEEGLGAFFPWQERRASLRTKLATLIGATSDDSVALTASTTRGISDIALSIPWKKGDRVVLFEGEFPTNVTPWQCAARLYDLKLSWLKADDFDSGSGLEQLEDTLRTGVRLVAVSAVQFQSGLQMPLAEMGALCSQYNAELFVDAIQALGVVPLDVEACKIDYLSSGSHKWLMGMEGAGLLYVQPSAAKRLTPPVAGWRSHEHGEDFLRMGAGHLRYDRPLKTTARVFEGSAQNVLGFAALEASVDLLLDLGVANIFEHVQRYHDALEPVVTELGFKSLRSTHRAHRSGSLACRPAAGRDLTSIQRSLFVSGVSCSMPDGLLRFAPHWPNHINEVSLIAEKLKEALAR